MLTGKFQCRTCLYDICTLVDIYQGQVHCIDQQTLTLSYRKEIRVGKEDPAFIIGEHRCYVCFTVMGPILRTSDNVDYVVLGRHKCIVNGTPTTHGSKWKDTIKTLDTVA